MLYWKLNQKLKLIQSKEIDKIEKEVKKKTKKQPPKDIFKKFKKLVISKEKKTHHHVMCMESYFIEQPAMSFQDYEFLHLAAMNKKQDKDDEQKELPLKFVLGVTLMLGGAFVMFATPVCPMLGYAGEMMMTTGLGYILGHGVDIYEKEY